MYVNYFVCVDNIIRLTTRSVTMLILRDNENSKLFYVIHTLGIEYNNKLHQYKYTFNSFT